MRKPGTALIAGAGLLGAAMLASPAGAAMVVDGNLSDWGVNVQDYTGACGTNDPTQCIGTHFETSAFSSVQNYNGLLKNTASATLPGGALKLASSLDSNPNEDGNDVSNNYGADPELSPGTGGQNFDAEFMAVAQGRNNDGKLYVAIVTGQRPDNGIADWQPGDLKIAVSALGGPATGIYGIELGGGAASTSTSDAITAPGGTGSTYSLDANGYSTGESSTAWGTGAILANATFDPLSPNQLAGGTPIGVVGALYESLNSNTTEHNVIELQIDLATLLQTSDPAVWAKYQIEFMWGPADGRDIALSAVQDPVEDIAEPRALTLLLFGVGAAARMRHRKAA